MSTTVVRAPAKVNLFLRVLARERSGYHGIETLFAALALHDTLRVRTRDRPGVGLRVEADEDLGPADRNLAVRAARAYRTRAGLEAEPGVEVHLKKRIPAGAGLGGGSSDAAATLRALDRMHEGLLERAELLEIAAHLGSDVPFFLSRRPLALGWGRGGRLLCLPPLPERPVVLVVPSFRVSTARAYGSLDTAGAKGEEGGGPGARIVEAGDLSSWRGVVFHAANDFEDPVFDAHPEGARIRRALTDAGARPALLSGSGSAVFGVFGGEGEAETAARKIGEAFAAVRVIRTRTLSKWPEAGREG